MPHPDPGHPHPLPPMLDGRAAPRQRTMFVIGRIVGPTREHVCLVRNISATGSASITAAGWRPAWT